MGRQFQNLNSKIKKWIPHQAWRSILQITILALMVIFVFQNCADPLELSDQDASTFSANLPFAFDAKADTFAYMSCNTDSTDYNPREIFTFRVGGYGPDSGIKLTDEFLQSTAGFTNEGKAEALFRSPSTSGSILQLGIRSGGSDYQAILLNSQGSVIPGMDLGNFFSATPLDAPGLAQRLVTLSDGERIRYFNNTPGLEGRFFEQSIRFPNRLKSMTDALSNSSVVMSYSADNSPVNYFAKGPDQNNLNRNIYGIEFQPGLTGPVAVGSKDQSLNVDLEANRILNRLNVIEDITQKSSRASVAWSCSTEHRYTIVRPEDNVIVGTTPQVCPTSDHSAGTLPNQSRWLYDDPTNLTAAQQKELEIVRRIIRVEDYYVNLDYKCIVPKSGKDRCYPSPTGSGSLTINYNGPSCNDDPATDEYCPNFVSICLAPTI